MENISEYFDFPLRKNQSYAFNEIIQFLKNDDQKVFILKGYAGTGKTTLMGGLINYLNKQKIPFALLASTGRAAKILSDKTKTRASTVHSHIYSFKDLSEDLEEMSKKQHDMNVDDKGQVSLVFDLRPITSETTKIYIIDEASMISDTADKGASFAQFGSGDLLSDILNYDSKGKFIFVGDPCQLPPINQSNSPALSASHISQKQAVKASEFELTEIVRQASDNGIIKASMRLRELYYKNPPVTYAKFPIKEYSNILLHNSHANLLNTYIQTLKSKGFAYSTLICQLNKQCADLNNIIRQTLFKTEQRLVPGDLLLVTQNNYVSNFVNGDLIMVHQVGDKEFRCGLTFRKVEVSELSSDKLFNVLLVEDILYGNTTNLNNKQHKDLMIDYYQRMKSQGIFQKDPKFKENMLKDPYLNALKTVYGYALTCHKSQGGEWDEVFLYLDNKIHGLKKPGIYQWVYTSLTRARNQFHVVNDWFIA